MKPLITALVDTYNHERYIEQARQCLGTGTITCRIRGHSGKPFAPTDGSRILRKPWIWTKACGSKSMSSKHYTKSWYAGLRSGSIRSAEIIVPVALELLSVRNVVDIGCGERAWLAVFRKLGVSDVLGVNGEYIDPGDLQIPEDSFQAANLSKPLVLGRTFDWRRH